MTKPTFVADTDGVRVTGQNTDNMTGCSWTSVSPVLRHALLVGLFVLGGSGSAWSAYPNPVELSQLYGGNGFAVSGATAGDWLGMAANAGDINGDGIDDMVFGAHLASPGSLTEAGAAYVVFGRGDGFAPDLLPATLDGSNGFTFKGSQVLSAVGERVAAAGDINGDGVGDLLVSADVSLSAGKIYVIFGHTGPFTPTLESSALNGGNGFTIPGKLNSSNWLAGFGHVIAGVGDLNNDAIDDFAIGAFDMDPDGRAGAGRTYVVFGHTGNFDPSFDVATLNGGNGFIVNGIDDGDASGISISKLGDVNGDGIDDLLIGAGNADPGGRTDAGEAYVVYGRDGAFSAVLELSSLNGDHGFVINGRDAGDNAGGTVAGGGDINGDGVKDIVIGAANADPGDRDAAGETYVIFGKSESFSSPLELSSLNGNNGFSINGIESSDRASKVATGGDINGDATGDLVIGSLSADPEGRENAGVTYVLFGHMGSFNSEVELSSLNGNNGFQINGNNAGDLSPASLGMGGDFNADGFDDIVIATPYADPGSRNNAGQGYVVLGGKDDAVPDGFSFADVVDVALNSFLSSNTIIVTGLNTAAPISVENGSYHIVQPFSVTSGAPSAALSSNRNWVKGGDSVYVAHVSAADYRTSTTTTLTIGGVSATFVSTTMLDKYDLNGDDKVDSLDIGILMSKWGGTGVSADFDDNGIVNSADLELMLNRIKRRLPYSPIWP